MKNFILERLLNGIQSTRNEMKALHEQGRLWFTTGSIINSGGTLGLHIAGNLQHFLGAELGKTGYVRDRDREFHARDLSLDEVINELDKAHAAVEKAFEHITDDTITKPYPQPFLGHDRSVLEVLFILDGHLQYHMGQIKYLRRMGEEIRL